jgi:hypothetical protein
MRDSAYGRNMDTREQLRNRSSRYAKYSYLETFAYVSGTHDACSMWGAIDPTKFELV